VRNPSPLRSSKLQRPIDCRITIYWRVIRLNNCYYYQDLRWRPFHLLSLCRLRHDRHGILLANTIPNKVGGGGEVIYFSAINFQGHSIRQLSCYTLPSECLLPWPSYCCFHGVTPFMVSDEYIIRHFSHQLTVHPTLSVLLTKTDPLRTLIFCNVSVDNIATHI